MNRILLGLFSVALCFSLGYTLECYSCKIGFWNLCLTTKATCSANDHCFSGKGKAAGVLDVTMKGCLEVSQCNKTTDVNFSSGSNSTWYKMTKTCCNTDLCNAATPLANTHALTLGFGSLVTLLLTKALM